MGAIPTRRAIFSVITFMQTFRIAADETAVLQAKFLTRKGGNVKIYEDENAEWSTSDPAVIKIVSSNFDKTNYNVTIEAQSTGIANLYAKGNFEGNVKADDKNFFGYEVSGFCQIEVRPPLVKEVFFTLSHRIPTDQFN